MSWKWSKAKVTQSCPTLCDPVDYTVHGILQARILEWVAIPFSRGSSQPRDWTQVSCIAGGFFTRWAIREAHGPFFQRNVYLFEIWLCENVTEMVVFLFHSKWSLYSLNIDVLYYFIHYFIHFEGSS